MEVKCLEVKMVPIGELKPHPDNANDHPEDQIVRLAKIIEYQGWRAPIKVSNRSGFITAGHGRLLAAQLNKYTEVPVSFQDYTDDDQELADVHADNAIALWAELDLGKINTQLEKFDPNFDLEMLGLKNFTLDAFDKFDHGDEDAVPEAPVVPAVKRGELWILGEHRLLIDDCTVKENVERLMGGEKADLLYTDPPYGDVKLLADNNVFRFSEGQNNVASATKYKKYGNEGSFSFDNFLDVAQPHAEHLIIWGGNCFPLPISTCWIVWDKSANEDATGNWFSDCELAWTNLKMPIIKIRHVLQGMIQESKEERVHPTQKPVAMHEKCWARIEKSIKGNFSSKTILDMFSGSGSTLIACEKTNRRCFGMEIDPHYGQVIIERYLKFTGRNDVYRLDDNGHKTPWSEVANKPASPGRE